MALELLQGMLDVLILRTLAGEPMHGYAVSQWIRAARTGCCRCRTTRSTRHSGGWRSADGLRREWELSENNRRAAYYWVTADGRKQLGREIATWRRYAAAVFQVLEPEEAG